MATSTEEAKKQEFRELCEKLTTDDPSIKALNISEYGKLDWAHTSQLAAALVQNTHVREMYLCLQPHLISPDGHTPLIHFLGNSTILHKVSVDACGETPAQDLGATSILEACSHNQSVVALKLSGKVYRRPEMLETMLGSTQALTEFGFDWREDWGAETSTVNALAVSHALRCGLQQNTSLESATLNLGGGGPQVSDVLFGLVSLVSLQKLELEFKADAISSEALRFFLAGNDTLESLHLLLSCSATETSSAMTALLVGLSRNRGLKDFRLDGSVFYAAPTNTCANAWTEMLTNNSTLEEFTYFNRDGAGGTGDFGPSYASAIASGLSKNVSLQKLQLHGALAPGAFDGATWRDALHKNTTLRELDLEYCNIGSCSDFAAFTQGLTCNKSLKILKLARNAITSPQAVALVQDLQANDCLEYLNLSSNRIRGPTADTVVRGLWSKKGLLHLDLSSNTFGDQHELSRASFFTKALPKNETLKRLDISNCNLKSNDFCVVVNSLKGSSTIQTITCTENTGLLIDGFAAIAVKDLFLGSSLARLDLYQTKVTRAGMAEVATGIRGNTRLKELNFSYCEGIDNETLFVLGEALQVNSTLESLSVDANDFDDEGKTRFFGLLPRMKGIKELTMTLEQPDETLVEAVIEGLRRNTSLERLDEASNFDLPADVAKQINFYLKMNRNGRKYLQEGKAKKNDTHNETRADMPHIGAWPRVLAKMSSTSEQDQLFYFLRRKTDLFQGPAPSRKRKATEADSTA